MKMTEHLGKMSELHGRLVVQMLRPITQTCLYRAAMQPGTQSGTRVLTVHCVHVDWAGGPRWMIDETLAPSA